MGADILLYLVEYRCRGRWRRTTRPPRQSRNVYVSWGTLTDGGCYVDVIKGDGDTCLPYPDEQTAREVAQQWMERLGGEWEQVECYPTQGWQPGEQDQGSTGSHS